MMRGHITKRPGKQGWTHVVDLGDQPARRCDAAKRHRVWVDADHDTETCPAKVRREVDGRTVTEACGATLGPAAMERRQQWTSGFPSRKAAEADLRARLGVLDGGGDPFPATITLAELVHDRWVPHLETQDRPREQTRRKYVALLERWVLPDLGRMDVAKIGPRHLQAVLDKVVAAGKAPRTVGHVRAAASAVFAQAVRWQLVAANPVRATQTPTAPKPELRIPDARELRALVQAAVGTPWEVAVLLAATTGARRTEVLGVRWRHVDLDAGRVRITETIVDGPDGLTFGPPKTKSALRTVPLPPWAAARLRAHKAEQAQRRLALGAAWRDLDLVCDRGDGQPISPGAFTHGFRRLAERTGFAGMRLHDVRHGVATALAKSGASPLATSRMLGHASVAFTQSVYQHADDEMVDLAAQRLADALGT